MTDIPAAAEAGSLPAPPTPTTKPGPVPHTHPGYVGRCVLAPMVRTGELPTRLLALRYGADTVWGPEIIDKGIIGTERIDNAVTDTIDFVKPAHNGKEQMVFRTHKTLEKARRKCIFQIGTASPELAVQAARLVADDVAGVDLNSGCPKHFSVHSGMGAALLQNPDNLTAILRALVSEVGKPFNIPISVKIRILYDLDTTLALVHKLCETGICRITVHCRTTPMRPREAPIRDYLSAIADVCHSHNVACYANGDVRSRMHADELISQYGIDGCMIAIAAEKNPSVFSTETARPWEELVAQYLEYSQAIGHYFSNTKFCLTNIMAGGSETYQKVTQTRSVLGICEVLGLPYKPLTPEMEKEDRELEEKAKAAQEQKQKIKEAQEANKLKQENAKVKAKENKEKQRKKAEALKKGKEPNGTAAGGDTGAARKKRKRSEREVSGEEDGKTGTAKKPEVMAEVVNAAEFSAPEQIAEAVAVVGP